MNQTNKNKTRKHGHGKTIITCLDFLNNLKLFHWNTHSYSEHMAADELFEDLTKKIDKMIESFLQVRVPIKATILLNTNKASFLKKLKQFKQFMNKISLPNELYSLRDEIVIDIDQFEYRLTLTK
jgi:DNA-binding ferritin-like protein